MSCEKWSSKLAAAAAGLWGLPRRASQAAYLAGLRWLGSARALLAAEDRQAGSLDAAALPQLRERTISEPATAGAAPCPGCGAGLDKAGPWYQVGGRRYCVDCAPAAARQLGGRLAVAPAMPNNLSLPVRNATDKPQSAGSNPRTGAGAVRLKAGVVDITIGAEAGRPRLLRLEEAYLVLRNNRPTGLAITPDVDAQTGLLQQGVWAVTHLDTGLKLAGGFVSLLEAEGLAVMLAHIDWTRPFEAMPRRAIADAGQIIGTYRRTLARAAGDQTEQVWRDRALDGQLVRDAFGDVAYVREDLGEKLRLAGPEGPYDVPRAMVGPPAAHDYRAAGIAEAIEPEPGSLCSNCLKEPGPDESWYRVQGGLFCESCASGAAGQAGLLLPQDWIGEVNQMTNEPVYNP